MTLVRFSRPKASKNGHLKGFLYARGVEKTPYMSNFSPDQSGLKFDISR